jgi:3-hydroxyanthranilate 3,4-dioxygenase
MSPLKAFNFRAWIDQHREFLKPPVCNRQVFRHSELIIMVVGGPNARSDYHEDPGEEFFYQLEGDMLLRTMQEGARVDIPIREGDILLLPPRVPHSPQRYANTVGLVIERQRRPEEQDGFLWYCDHCQYPLYAEYLHVSDIEKQLPPIFERFYGSAEKRTCQACGTVAHKRHHP